jgi:esterase/lipase
MTARILHETCISTNVRLSRVRQKAVHGFLDVLWKVTPTLTKLLVKKVFFTPSTYKLTPVEKQYLENGESFQLSVHDKTVQCWKWGRGPSILLAHGWNGRGIQLHHFIEPLMQRGYSVIGYDAPGHGVSQGKTSSYFEFTDTIRALLTSSNGHKIQGVVAHSLGASATVNSIAKEAQPLEAVLIAPALRFAEVLTCFFDHVGVPNLATICNETTRQICSKKSTQKFLLFTTHMTQLFHILTQKNSQMNFKISLCIQPRVWGTSES